MNAITFSYRGISCMEQHKNLFDGNLTFGSVFVFSFSFLEFKLYLQD